MLSLKGGISELYNLINSPSKIANFHLHLLIVPMIKRGNEFVFILFSFA